MSFNPALPDFVSCDDLDAAATRVLPFVKDLQTFDAGNENMFRLDNAILYQTTQPGTAVMGAESARDLQGPDACPATGAQSLHRSREPRL